LGISGGETNTNQGLDEKSGAKGLRKDGMTPNQSFLGPYTTGMQLGISDRFFSAVVL